MIPRLSAFTGPRFARLLLLGLTLLPLSSQAETTLRDAWLEQATLPAAGYAVYQRADDVAHHRRQGRELQAELGLAARHAAERGELPWAHAFARWEQQMAAYRQAPQQARTPGRVDLTALVAAPRHTPRLSALAHFGGCEPPTWVEVWHVGGVTRLTHRSGMTVAQALDTASEGRAQRQVDRAWRISPLGRVRDVGIAAWNHEPIEVTPGSRVVQRLPDAITADDALGGADWIDDSLPRYLATRLPGDRCTLHPLPNATDESSP